MGMMEKLFGKKNADMREEIKILKEKKEVWEEQNKLLHAWIKKIDGERKIIKLNKKNLLNAIHKYYSQYKIYPDCLICAKKKGEALFKEMEIPFNAWLAISILSFDKSVVETKERTEIYGKVDEKRVMIYMSYKNGIGWFVHKNGRI